jgi:hypothetical protein
MSAGLEIVFFSIAPGQSSTGPKNLAPGQSSTGEVLQQRVLGVENNIPRILLLLMWKHLIPLRYLTWNQRPKILVFEAYDAQGLEKNTLLGFEETCFESFPEAFQSNGMTGGPSNVFFFFIYSHL